jgi:hypothetical protein
VILGLGRFGAEWMDPRLPDHRDVRWAMVSLMRRYSGDAVGTVEVVAGERAFTLVARDGGLRVRDGGSEVADVRVVAPVPAVFAIFAGGRAPESVGVVVEGDRSVLDAVLAGLGGTVGG